MRIVLRYDYDETPDGHWLWSGALISTKPGRDYGTIMIRGERWLAHRLAYKLLVGPIPPGTEIDHKCRTPRCIRPDHLEAVTHQVNVLRGVSPSAEHARREACPNGHPYDGHDSGGRFCRACRNATARGWYAENRGTGEGTGSTLRARTHCPQGHPYDEENTYWRERNGKRSRACRTCLGHRPASSSRARPNQATECVNGHPWSEETTRHDRRQRVCIPCERERTERRRLARQAAREARAAG